MSRWAVARLGDIADESRGEIRTGPFGSQLHRHEYTQSPDGIPVVMPLNMVDGRIDSAGIARITPAKSAEMSAHITRPGDVLLSRRGDIGRFCLVDAATAGALCGTGSLRVSIQGSKLMPEYLCFFLRTPLGLHELQGKAVGSTMPNINASIVRSLEVPVPPLSDQRKIVAILSAYEGLNENHHRRIGLLDAMAQRVYREWFVDFRYPGHDRESLIDSDVGPIPKGWSVGILDDVLSVMEAGSRPKGGIDPHERGVPSVGAENVIGLGQYDFGKEKFVTRAYFEHMRRGHIVDGDVVLYKDGAYIGRVSLFRDGFPHSECAVNEHVFVLRTNERYSQSLLYFWLAHPGNQDRVRALNANAAQPGLNQERLRALQLAIPPPSLVRRFTKTVDPALGMLFRLALGVPRSRDARDLLLPRLISGSIDVAELDIAVPDAAA